MEGAVVHVGRAVVTTSVALSCGFFVLTMSSWASVASFGLISGISILGAMVADLIVLPALVLTIARLQERSRLARRLWSRSLSWVSLLDATLRRSRGATASVNQTTSNALPENMGRGDGVQATGSTLGRGLATAT